MILNHQRQAVWAWDGQSVSQCPLCNEPLVARRCRDRVWHWAHKPHTDQKRGTCLFDDSEWALKWRLGYHMFPDWKIEVPKEIEPTLVKLDTLLRRKILLHAINPKTKQVREFISHINEASEPRFKFLMGAQTHQVMWMLDGKQWTRALAKQVGKDESRKGYRDFLKPKAQQLYERICKVGQTVLVHIDGPNGGTLYKEWVKQETNGVHKVGEPDHTGIWFPMTGDKALAILDNFSKVTLPYDVSKSEPAKLSKFEQMLEKV